MKEANHMYPMETFPLFPIVFPWCNVHSDVMFSSMNVKHVLLKAFFLKREAFSYFGHLLFLLTGGVLPQLPL